MEDKELKEWLLIVLALIVIAVNVILFIFWPQLYHAWFCYKWFYLCGN
jgi:hypothetical protein